MANAALALGVVIAAVTVLAASFPSLEFLAGGSLLNLVAIGAAATAFAVVVAARSDASLRKRAAWGAVCASVPLGLLMYAYLTSD